MLISLTVCVREPPYGYAERVSVHINGRVVRCRIVVSGYPLADPPTGRIRQLYIYTGIRPTRTSGDRMCGQEVERLQEFLPSGERQ